MLSTNPFSFIGNLEMNLWKCAPGIRVSHRIACGSALTAENKRKKHFNNSFYVIFDFTLEFPNRSRCLCRTLRPNSSNNNNNKRDEKTNKNSYDGITRWVRACFVRVCTCEVFFVLRERVSECAHCDQSHCVHYATASCDCIISFARSQRRAVTELLRAEQAEHNSMS